MKNQSKSSQCKALKNESIEFLIKNKPGLRKLTRTEIVILENLNNEAENWESIYVSDHFNPHLVKNNTFCGLVAIGDLEPKFIEYKELRLPVGIYHSYLCSCMLGSHVAIHQVKYLAHYMIEDHCLLFNIGQLNACPGAANQTQPHVISLEIGNENGNRKIMAFPEIIPADAYLWSKFRDHAQLMAALTQMTTANLENRGPFRKIGKNSHITNTTLISHVEAEESTYIEGASQLSHLYIHSSAKEPAYIGMDSHLINGVVHAGAKIGPKATAINFILGKQSQLKLGVRLLDSFLGDNSTIACCEVLNSLIYPFHEQHHNNSFLIAAVTLGQSNIAAGSTIGSNHNSRSPDGELIAGRGFWPGLCSNFKHNSKFAAFSLIAKGSYDYELNISYPFSLIYLKNNDPSVHIMPGYWFQYNMFALARNNYKFKKRDKRKTIVQNIIFDYLAPDTINEMLAGLERLYQLGGEFSKPRLHKKNDTRNQIKRMGKIFLNDPINRDIALFDADGMKKQGAWLEKSGLAVMLYEKMLHHFAVNTLLQTFSRPSLSMQEWLEEIILFKKNHPLYLKWSNLGGQLIPDERLNQIKEKIVAREIVKWAEVHAEYRSCWKQYPLDLARYAVFILEDLLDLTLEESTAEQVNSLLKTEIEINRFIYQQAYQSRLKDYHDPFRKIVYENEQELKAVLGDIESNDFLIDLKSQTEKNIARIKQILSNHYSRKMKKELTNDC